MIKNKEVKFFILYTSTKSKSVTYMPLLLSFAKTRHSDPHNCQRSMYFHIVYKNAHFKHIKWNNVIVHQKWIKPT